MDARLHGARLFELVHFQSPSEPPVHVVTVEPNALRDMENVPSCTVQRFSWAKTRSRTETVGLPWT